MTEFLCGLFGFILSAGIFALGFYAGRKSKQPVAKAEISEEAQEQARLERERLIEDQKAFRVLTGYSADIAYGISKFSEEDSA